MIPYGRRICNAQREFSLTLWTQLYLIVGVCQVYLGEAISTTELAHQVFRKRYGVTVGLQLRVDGHRIVATHTYLRLHLAREHCLPYWYHWCPISVKLCRLPCRMS